MSEADLLLPFAIALFAVMAVVGVVAGVLRWRSHRRVDRLAHEPAPTQLECVIGTNAGRRLLEQARSLVAQLEPAARYGSGALVGHAGEGGVGDSIQRALEECTRDWARGVSMADEHTRALLTALGLTPEGARDIADRVAERERAHYRAALAYFEAAERRLTADPALGVYR